MKLLSKSEQMCIAAGIASLSNEGITVTGKSTMVLNDYGFSSQGYIYDADTNEVIHDFIKGTKSYCIPDILFTATPIQGGYMYKMGRC